MIDENDKKHLRTLVSIMQNTNKDLKKEKFPWLKELSSNIPFVLILTVGALVGSGFALATLTTLGNFILPISAGVGIVAGVAIPKIVHAILENSNGNIGRIYTKHNLHKYFKAMINFLNSKEFGYLISHPENISKLNDEQIQAIVSQIYAYTKNLCVQIDKMLEKKVIARTNKDLKAINKLIQKLNNNPSKEAAITKQIQKIVDKNVKFVSPWCKLYNTYSSNAKKLFTFINDWDGDFEIPQIGKADELYLSKKVIPLLCKQPENDAVEVSGINKTETQSLLETNETNETKQNAKLSSFEELKTYLQK